MLDELFHDDARTIRYGVNEILYGYYDIKSFRAARSPVALGRKFSRTVITTYGRDFAVASTLYERPSAPGKIGRQMQTWVKFPQGWRVVVGHVSLMDRKYRSQSAATACTSTSKASCTRRSIISSVFGG